MINVANLLNVSIIRLGSGSGRTATYSEIILLNREHVYTQNAWWQELYWQCSKNYRLKTLNFIHQIKNPSDTNDQYFGCIRVLTNIFLW